MEHEIRDEQGATVVAFKGDVDLQSSPEARKVLLEAVARGTGVLVDLSGVDYIDSSGVASLVESYQAARKQNQGYVLVSLSESALRVLELARLDKVFTLCDTIPDGLKEIG